MINNKPAVALITGGAGKIGLAIGERLAQDGHRIVLVDISASVHVVAQELRDRAIDARAVQIDITDPQAVQTLPEQLGDWWADLSILINNAGISPKANGQKSPVMNMSLEEWNSVMAVNLNGMFLVTRTCLQSMHNRGWGRIVMIASQAARTRTIVPGAHYQASKAATVGFARVLAAEVAQYGITVNCVAPGRIESNMTAAVDTTTNTSLASAIPAARMGAPSEVAEAVAYFTSEHSGYCVGAILDVNGGSFMP
ncbi:MAG: SDR family oxidoreductase [Advenella sp.]|uniref:NAD(P)-dependent oxidoreductase n=1 Tax=Advenella kashmirensis TaxID=310575 RepID=A0A356LKV6_9BURK|nr:SDR family NAD(P)-dependent oxidoreductase [Advenella sp. FME57]HBP31606.1 NAD(P)-dependent oxidoreductase [Advenella kashmirensis]